MILYYFKIDNMYKVGITKNGLPTRFGKATLKDMTDIYQWELAEYTARAIEKYILTIYKQYRAYNEKFSQDGGTEFFSIDIIDKIKPFIETHIHHKRERVYPNVLEFGEAIKRSRTQRLNAIRRAEQKEQTLIQASRYPKFIRDEVDSQMVLYAYTHKLPYHSTDLIDYPFMDTWRELQRAEYRPSHRTAEQEKQFQHSIKWKTIHRLPTETEQRLARFLMLFMEL